MFSWLSSRVQRKTPWARRLLPEFGGPCTSMSEMWIDLGENKEPLKNPEQRSDWSDQGLESSPGG